MSHTLVVGGTGMLADMTLEMATAGEVVSVVARSHRGLGMLAAHATALGGRINPISCDYHDSQTLAMGVRAAASAHGPFERAVCWIHSTAPRATQLVAELVGASGFRGPVDFVHVLGVEAAGPDAGVYEYLEVRRTPGIRYRRVILGFVVEAGGARWLSNPEISAGVLRAVRSGAEETILGQAVPWTLRPN